MFTSFDFHRGITGNSNIQEGALRSPLSIQIIFFLSSERNTKSLKSLRGGTALLKAGMIKQRNFKRWQPYTQNADHKTLGPATQSSVSVRCHFSLCLVVNAAVLAEQASLINMWKWVTSTLPLRKEAKWTSLLLRVTQ